ncbi:MAG: DUF3853 family protein [Prevotella sp.]|nr:DUF3853 family protein [Prevotella sp.]
MIRKGVLPQQSVSPSVYEAVGKLLLSNAVAGSPLKPVVGLNDKVTCSDDDPEYVALLNKPLWQFTGKDHAYMMKHVLMESLSVESTEPSSQKRYVQGYQGIASLFGCSKSTAQRIKKSGIIDEAITQVNRKILVDADLALQLVKESGCKMNEL